MANMAKSVGINGVQRPESNKSLWGSALASLKEKKRKENEAELEKLQKELAEALDRAKKAENECKDVLKRLRETEDELKTKTKLLEKAENRVKLLENKNKRLENQKGSVISPKSQASESLSGGAKRKLLPESGEHSPVNSDDEEFVEEVTQLRSAPIKGAAGCCNLPRVEGSLANAALAGKLYEKRAQSVPQLISSGKAATPAKTKYQMPWIEPYLQNVWNSPGGAFAQTKPSPFAITWSTGFGASLSKQSKDQLALTDSRSECKPQTLAPVRDANHADAEEEKKKAAELSQG